MLKTENNLQQHNTGISGNKQFCLFICLSLFYLFFINAVNGIDYFESVKDQIATVFKAVIGVYILILLPKLLKMFDLKDFYLLFASALIITTNYIFFPDLNSYFILTATDFASICLPIALISSKISDYDCFFKYLITTSRIIAILSIIFVFDYFASTKSISFQNSYSMGLGYGVIIPILTLLYNTTKNKTKIDCFFLFILFFVLVLYCSRGPLFSIGLFFIYLIISRNIKEKKGLNIVLFLFFLLVIAFSYRSILYSIGLAFKSIDLQSRTIQLLSESLDEVVFLNRRDELWRLMTDDILESPFKIRGINAEWVMIGGYAHSIIYELSYQLGLLLGGFLLLVIFFLVVNQLITNTHNTTDDLLIIFMLAAIPPLTVSNSLWISSSFWLWIGLTMGAHSKRKKTDSPELRNETILLPKPAN